MKKHTIEDLVADDKKIVIEVSFGDFLTKDMKKELQCYGISLEYLKAGDVKGYGMILTFDDSYIFKTISLDLKDKEPTMGFIFFCFLIKMFVSRKQLENTITNYSHYFGDIDLITKDEKNVIAKKSRSFLKNSYDESLKKNKFRKFFSEFDK